MFAFLRAGYSKQWWLYGIVYIAYEMVLKAVCFRGMYLWNPSNLPTLLSFPEIFGVKTRVTCVRSLNYGSAFGMMAGYPPWQKNTLLSVVFLITLFLFNRVGTDPKYSSYKVGAFVFLIGAIGNLIDRLMVGAVVDYVDISFQCVGGKDSWCETSWLLGGRGFYELAFNLSDLVINAGVGLLLAFGRDPDYLNEAKNSESGKATRSPATPNHRKMI